MKWQPIETAPTMHCARALVRFPCFLFYDDNKRGEWKVGEAMYNANSNMWRLLKEGRELGADELPTHWMPLPSPDLDEPTTPQRKFKVTAQARLTREEFKDRRMMLRDVRAWARSEHARAAAFIAPAGGWLGNGTLNVVYQEHKWRKNYLGLVSLTEMVVKQLRRCLDHDDPHYGAEVKR